MSIITSDQHSVALARAACAAFMLGRCDALAASLHASGFNTEVSGAMLLEIGRDYASLWGVNDKSRKRCFHCASPTRPGRLCDCYERALPQQLVAFELEVLKVLPPGAPAISYICSDCGVHAATPVRDVLRAIAAGKPFKGHTRCSDCHADHRRAQPRTAKPQRPLRAPLRDLANLNAAAQAVAAEAGQA